jgi:glutathione S-transferase
MDTTKRLARATTMAKSHGTVHATSGGALKYTIWGSVLSPFSLKVRAMCDFAHVDYQWLPADGTLIQGLRFNRRVQRLKAGRLPLTYPPRDELDEYPLVPFLFGDDGSNIYDSTAIAEWLDAHHGTEARRLIPKHPACELVARLIDDHFDEFGLYVAHHHRWVTSAKDNDAGERVANEMVRALPALGRRQFAQWFARRQVRRLPYLFSVAPEGYCSEGLPQALTPPSRPDFPETHTLLDDAFTRSLDLVENVLRERPFLFGNRFTLADASVYGELGMNTSDPAAEQIIAERAPTLRAWLERLHERGASKLEDGEEPAEAHLDALAPLLDEIVQIHVPLMEQNERAYERHRAEGQTRFNEAAFQRNEALYDGELLGQPFRAVAKTFQVKGWRNLKARYRALEPAHRSALPVDVRNALDDAITCP